MVKNRRFDADNETEQKMTGITDYKKMEQINLEAASPPKYNRMWGNDFLLMDSNNFMGGADGSGYEKIIDVFVNIWNVNDNRLLAQ